MNRVAVITDIHANLPALEATLSEVECLGADAVYCGGDLVGYGPHPNEVCEVMESREIPTIYGNYDYAIGRDLEDCGCAYVDKHDREIGQLSVDWTLAHASREAKDLEDKPARTFERIAALADCDVLVFGHTHKPWIHDYAGIRFVNCGAVGKPKDHDPRVAFAILEAQDGAVSASIRRVGYDATAVAHEMRAVGLPEELAEKLVAAA